MLVIERVPLELVQEIVRVHNLQAEHTVWCQERVNSRQYRLRVCVVRKQVATVTASTLPIQLDQLIDDLGSEGARDHAEVPLARELGDVGR